MRKMITPVEMVLIRRMPVLTAVEIRKLNDEARRTARETRRQRRVDAAVQAAMPQIQSMRDEGASFIEIQRVFARARIDIGVDELRSTFEKLQARAEAAAPDSASVNIGEKP